MSSLGSIFKAEITRLARKEIRAQINPLRKANSAHRSDIAALKREVAGLQRQIKALARPGKGTPEPVTDEAPTRFSAKGLKSLRARLGLSAADFGKLAGVSGQSIYNWELGKAVPRKGQMAALAGVRAMGKREAKARLEQTAGNARRETKR